VNRPRPVLACFLLLVAAVPVQSLELLHWWKSTRERIAAGASTVLRSRILSWDIPDVVQASSVTARTWATLGLAVSSLIQPAGHVLAAPLGIHHVNTMFYNRRVFARLGLAPPTAR
jgi:glucose/mannose transport system substrate-binding protein